MKTIFTFCTGIFIPFLLLSQNSWIRSLDGNLVRKPYLIVDNKNKTYEKLLTVYKDYSQLNKLNEPQSIAVLANRQKLDSIIKVPILDTSIASHKSAFTFNSNGNITSSSEFDWDKATQNWYYITKKEWAYDASHYNLSYTTFYGDQQNWYNELKYDNTFNAKGQLTTVLGYGWNDITSQWDIGLKIENTYDEIGRDTTSITYEWDATNTKWNPTDKVEIDYNNDQQIKTHFVWDTIKSKWENSKKEEISYWYFGPEDTYTYYDWDGSADWLNNYQAIAFYDGNKKLENFTEKVWDVISLIWVNSKKTDYRYTGVDTNVIHSTYSKWVKQLQGFVADSRDSCFYNNQYQYEDLLLPPGLKFVQNLPRNPDNDVYFNHMLLKSSNFIYNGTTYLRNNEKTFYYSPIVVTKTNEPLSDSNVRLVPNPANDYFTISSDQSKLMDLRLFDLNGKLKIARKINSDEPVSTESLTKGLYLYRIITNDKKIQSGKLIVN